MKKEVFRPQPTNSSKAYLKLAKKIRYHWLWKASRKKSKFEAWIDLLIRASFESSKEAFGHDLIELQKGQLLCSQEGLAIDWGWDRSAVRHFIKLLEKDMMITSNITNKFTVITICNYDSYNTKQPAEQPAEHQVNFDDMSDATPEFNHDKELEDSGLQDEAASSATSTQHQDNTSKKKKKKNKYRDNVKLTKEENDRLVDELGQQFVDACYDYLRDYKIEKSYRSNDDNLTIRRWVIDAVQKKRLAPIIPLHQFKPTADQNPVPGYKNKNSYI